MKKLLFLMFASLVMIGCNTNQELCEKEYEVVVLDSCEYYAQKYRWDLSHKGNCKYCAMRDSMKWEKRKQELIDEIKK